MKLRAITSVKLKNETFSNAQTWGIFTSSADKLKSMILESDDGFIEHYYNYILISEFESDSIYPKEIELFWFKPIYEDEKLSRIETCSRPEELSGWLGFCF